MGIENMPAVPQKRIELTHRGESISENAWTEKTAYNVNHREIEELEKINQSVDRRTSIGRIEIEGAKQGDDIYKSRSA